MRRSESRSASLAPKARESPDQFAKISWRMNNLQNSRRANMDLDNLWAVAERARVRQKLSQDNQMLAPENLPKGLGSFPHLNLPKSINRQLKRIKGRCLLQTLGKSDKAIKQ
jgi:hypothetical protein